MRVKVKGRFLHETYKTYQLGEIAHAGVDAIALRDKLITLFADTMRILDPVRAKEFLSELPTFATASPPPTISEVVDNEQQVRRHIPRAVIYLTLLVPNAFAGLAIGVTNSSLLNVVLASVSWATLIWLVIAAILHRVSKSDSLFSGSPTIHRFTSWWAIPFVTSFIVGGVTYPIRASLL
jgi:hypothetical protein